MPAKERLIGILALLGFVAALIVHLPTQLGYDISKPVPMLFWALHGGAIMAWVLMSNSARNAFGKRLSPQEWLSVLPDWATWGKQILGAYALVNFAVFTYSAYRGSPAIRDGHYVLQQHGHIVRTLSLPEYEAAQLAVMRAQHPSKRQASQSPTAAHRHTRALRFHVAPRPPAKACVPITPWQKASFFG